MCSPRPLPTEISARTTSPAASTTPKPANAGSSANSKPSATRSPSNPPPRSRSPASITDQPGTQPGHQPLRQERAWSPQFRLSSAAAVVRAQADLVPDSDIDDLAAKLLAL